MSEPKQVQLDPLVVLNQTARLADIDREAWRNHIMLLAQREYELAVLNMRQAEEIARLRKALSEALGQPPEDPTASSAEETSTTSPPQKTEAEQLQAIRRHAMGEDD
ncbi:hypothetical protein [Mesorhizobium qingshengii]|uniref:Uncharacterized protein n=1 Tax=Mesorhizobium qingshengii TaxID=1165689 RepID=A0A1G5V203_9HYPH|nr:hypothetical protein [Mesorhizobium qingshengii]SDA39035.1 hypothetical protein SAMN02927914_00101 [Mesorhizobium qingshengii]